MSKMKNALEKAVEKYCFYHYGVSENEAMDIIMSSEKDISWWRDFPASALSKDARLIEHILVKVQEGRSSFDVAREINRKLEYDLSYQNGLIIINYVPTPFLAVKSPTAISIDVYDDGRFHTPEITI